MLEAAATATTFQSRTSSWRAVRCHHGHAKLWMQVIECADEESKIFVCCVSHGISCPESEAIFPFVSQSATQKENFVDVMSLVFVDLVKYKLRADLSLMELKS